MKHFEFDRGSKRKRSGINSLLLAGVWGRIVHTYSRLGLLVSGMNMLVHTHAAYLHFQPDGDISEMRGYKNGAVAGISPRLLGRVSVQGGGKLKFYQLSSQQKTCLFTFSSDVFQGLPTSSESQRGGRLRLKIKMGAKENPTAWAGEVRRKLEDASTSKSNESGRSFTA